MRVHSRLPDRHDRLLTRALDGLEHVPQSTPEAAAEDPHCGAFVGPWRSREVAEAIALLGPRGIHHIAPAATWVGLTRPDEPGHDPGAARRTLFRIAARDTVVCAAIVGVVGGSAQLVVDDTPYGDQIAAQLRLCGLRDGGDTVVYAGLGETAPDGLPADVLAMDGAAQHGFPERHPGATYFGAAYKAEGFSDAECWDFAPQVELAGRLLAFGDLESHFDAHGDLLDAPVGAWRLGDDGGFHPL
jgi:hypothetical protein